MKFCEWKQICVKNKILIKGQQDFLIQIKIVEQITNKLYYKG